MTAPLDSALPSAPGRSALGLGALRVRGDLVGLVPACLLVALALRVWAAIWDQGLVWPDEIFQTLEQAHRVVFGWGAIPWEFRDGARSWVYPGLIAAVWKVAVAVGVKRALVLICIAKLSMGLLSFGGVWAGTRLARSLGGDRAAFLAALFGAICPPIVVFGSRCTTETASAALVMFSVVLLEVTPLRRRAGWAGALMALAVLFRYQTGLVAAGLFLLLLARRRWLDALAYSLCAAVVVAIGAYVDVKTWGDPFHPLIAYLKFNLAPGGADRWGTSPFTFFSDHLGTSIGLSYSILLVGFLTSARRARGLVLVVLFFVLVHCAIGHKELRFITPILPLSVALAAVGLADLMNGLRQGARPTYILALVCGGQMAWSLRAPTLGDLGYGGDEEVVWHADEDYYRLTLEMGEKPDLCGALTVGTARAWTGGYTYLHREVPIFFDKEPRNFAASNYAIGAPDEKLPAGWRVLHARGKYALWRRDGTCSAVPADWSLNML